MIIAETADEYEARQVDMVVTGTERR